jgi:hypothetical protein
VGVDLDGVCYDIGLHLQRHLVALGHDPVRIAHLDSWDFWSRWGWTDEQFADACSRSVDAGVLFATGEPHPGTRDALSTLVRAGHEVHIVTARRFGTAPDASERATRTWLATHAIPFTSLTIAEDKASVPTDVFVEDSLANYEHLLAAGVTPYLVNRPWNAPYDDGRNRVTDISEFARVVLGS